MMCFILLVDIVIQVNQINTIEPYSHKDWPNKHSVVYFVGRDRVYLNETPEEILKLIGQCRKS